MEQHALSYLDMAAVERGEYKMEYSKQIKRDERIVNLYQTYLASDESDAWLTFLRGLAYNFMQKRFVFLQN